MSLILLLFSVFTAGSVGYRVADELHAHNPLVWGWAATYMVLSIYTLASAVKKSS